MHNRIDVPIHDQAPGEPAALGAVVLEIVAFVEDDAGEPMVEQRVDVALQEIVVDHDPAGETGAWRRLGAYHPCIHIAEREADLPHPVVFDRCRTDHEPRSRGFRLGHGDDRLPGLAETHVVGKDRPATPQQETYALHLVRVEFARDLARPARRRA